MCFKSQCGSCKKATWQGCGRHVDSALAGVPMEERCKCKVNYLFSFKYTYVPVSAFASMWNCRDTFFTNTSRCLVTTIHSPSIIWLNYGLFFIPYHTIQILTSLWYFFLICSLPLKQSLTVHMVLVLVSSCCCLQAVVVTKYFVYWYIWVPVDTGQGNEIMYQDIMDIRMTGIAAPKRDDIEFVHFFSCFARTLL